MVYFEKTVVAKNAETSKALTTIKYAHTLSDFKILGVNHVGRVIQEKTAGAKFHLDATTGDMINLSVM